MFLAVNGLASTPGVLPPFGLGLATPAALASAYGGALPSLGAFALAQSGALGSANPAGLRGLSNVLLVSNLNEEVNQNFYFHCPLLFVLFFSSFIHYLLTSNYIKICSFLCSSHRTQLLLPNLPRLSFLPGYLPDS